MSSSLKQTVHNDMKTAMKAKETLRLGTIRMLMAAIKQREIDEQTTLDNTAVIKTVEKMIKQRRDSAQQFEAANRHELAAKENDEIKILQVYMPQPLSESEISAAIDAAIQSTGANSMKDMGKVMGALKNQLQGRADMGVVSTKIKERLQ